MSKTITVGKYVTTVSDQTFTINSRYIIQLKEILGEWQRVFVKEDTWVQREMGVPSLFVRVDCTIHDGVVRCYEVEERPGGMGLLTQFVPGFTEKLAEIRREWPQFGYVASPSRGETEDGLWLDKVTEDSEQLVLVRAEPYEKQFHKYQNRSVSTVLTKGDKSYGIPMGWWKKADEDSVFSPSGFVLKPVRGSKCKDVFFRAPVTKLRKHQVREGVEKLYHQSNTGWEQIENLARWSSEMYYCQPFWPPMLSGIPGHDLMIYRLMFGFSPDRQKWEYIGGCWNGRSTLRIHGASDTLFGTVVVAD